MALSPDDQHRIAVQLARGVFVIHQPVMVDDGERLICCRDSLPWPCRDAAAAFKVLVDANEAG